MPELPLRRIEQLKKGIRNSFEKGKQINSLTKLPSGRFVRDNVFRILITDILKSVPEIKFKRAFQKVFFEDFNIDNFGFSTAEREEFLELAFNLKEQLYQLAHKGNLSEGIPRNDLLRNVISVIVARLELLF